MQQKLFYKKLIAAVLLSLLTLLAKAQEPAANFRVKKLNATKEFKFNPGGQNNGMVLKTDNDGNARWETPTKDSFAIDGIYYVKQTTGAIDSLKLRKQTRNKFWASAATGDSSTPSYRAIQIEDLPEGIGGGAAATLQSATNAGNRTTRRIITDSALLIGEPITNQRHQLKVRSNTQPNTLDFVGPSYTNPSFSINPDFNVFGFKFGGSQDSSGYIFNLHPTQSLFAPVRVTMPLLSGGASYVLPKSVNGIAANVTGDINIPLPFTIDGNVAVTAYPIQLTNYKKTNNMLASILGTDSNGVLKQYAFLRFANNKEALDNGAQPGDVYRASYDYEKQLYPLAIVAEAALRMRFNKDTAIANSNKFYFEASSDVSVTVDWGDGIIEEFAASPAHMIEHNYAKTGDFDVVVKISDFSLVTYFSAAFTQNRLKKIDGIYYLTALQDLRLNDNLLTSFSFSSTLPPSLQNLNISGNQLTQQGLNEALVYVNNSVFTSGTFSFENQPGLLPPTGDGDAAKAAMISRGCLVQTD